MRRSAFIVAVISVVLAGCGGSSTSTQTASSSTATSHQLDSQTDVQVAEAVLTLAKFCVHSLKGENTPQSEIDQVLAAEETLIRIYRQDPEATYTTSSRGTRTMRQVLSDEAGDLEKCNPSSARQFDRALANG